MSEEINQNQHQIKSHEEFMREASKQMVENLSQIKKEIHTIGNWVLFFGILSILGLVLGGCNLLLSF